ncbi:MAG: MBG domain-containing protein [Candidatus Methanomethylophilaceae archaeon]
MSRGIVARSIVITVAILSVISFAALFEYTEDADAVATNDIIFDLNGGSIGGQSSFVKTVGELNATGLPDASGSVIPSGKDEFVVWSEHPTDYSKLYNAGDPAPPNVATLYAVWGKYTATSGSINITGTGCHILNGATGITVSGSGSASLLVLNNSTLNNLQLSSSANVTILLQNENQIGSISVGASTIRLSSASTGDIYINSSNIWGSSSFIVDGGNLDIDKISLGGPVILNGGIVNVRGALQGSSVTIKEGAVLYGNSIYTSGALEINGSVTVTGMTNAGSITINGTFSSDSNLYTGGKLTINGNVTIAGKTEAGSVSINGTFNSNSFVYTTGKITIDGDVTVAELIQSGSNSIIVEGGTVVAGSVYPSPTVTGSAVVVINGKDIVESGWKYIEIIPGFDTDGTSGINVTFQFILNSEIYDRTLSLPEFTSRINLDPNSDLSPNQIEIRYFRGGTEYVSMGTAVPVSTPAPGYYVVNMTEGVPVNAQYTITFDSDGGSPVSSITQDYGTAVTAPAAPTKTGYAFAGWYPAVPATMPAGNVTIVAQWTVNQYTITFDSAGGSSVSAITQDYGTAVTAPTAPTKTGHTFAGWSSPVPSMMPAENMTLVAQWTVNQYTITWTVEGVTTDTQVLDYGATPVYAGVAPTKAADAQYTYAFSGWDPVISTVTGHQTYAAVFTSAVNQYTITWDVDGTQTTQSCDYGSTPAFAGSTDKSPTAQYTYTFAGWSPEIAPVTGDQTYTAQYSSVPRQYTITFDSAGGSAVTAITQDYGTTITPPADPTWAGHYFVGWDTELPMTMPAGNMTITAVWKTKVDIPVSVSGLVYNGLQQTGVVAATGYTLTGNTGTVAGSYSATATLSAGYIWSDETEIDKTIHWSINKASLTATYPGETIFFGETPILSVTVTGFVNSETELTAAGYVAPTVTNGNVDVGTYTLSPAGGSADNYEFTYVAGDLVIQAAAQTVTSSGYTGTYDGSAHGITVTQTGGTVTYSADGITYGADPLTYTGAGTYTVYFKVVKDNHSDYTGSETITINKASLTATYPGETIFFGETPILSVTVTGFVNSETELTAAGYVAPTVTNGNVDVGTYTLSPAGGSADNYEFTYVAGDLVIQAAAQTVTSSGYTGTYDGSAHGITVTQTGGTVTYSADGITYGADPLTYTGAGTYTVYFKVVKDNHSDYTGSETITINKASLTATYPGETIFFGETPILSVTVTGFVNSETELTAAGYVAPTVTNGNVDVGTYTLSPAGGSADNYEFTYVAGDLVIQAAAQTVTSSGYTGTYDGSAHGITVTQTGGTVTYSADGITYGADPLTYTGAGTYTVYFKVVKDNHSDYTGSETITINKASLTATYPGETIFFGETPILSVTVTGFVNSETELTAAGYVAPTVTNGNVDVGTYTLSPAGGSADNYEFTYVAGDLVIQAAAQTVTSSGYTGTYDGSAHGITVTQTGGTVTYSADGITYGADPLTYTGAGTYTVYFKVVKDNHSDYTGSETITINKASLTATYPGETIFFGETPILSVTVTGFVNSETELTAAGYVAPTVTNGNVDVGTYTLSPAGGSADNYEFTYVAGDLVIQAAAQTVTSSGYTGTYDGSAHGITVTQTGGTVTYSADGITYGADPLTYTGAGTYTVYFKVVKDNHSDYTGSETITINKASLTATYPGETIFFGETPILSVTVTGFVNSETELTAAGYVAPTVTNGNVDVGTYTLSPAGGSADNYEFTYVAGDLVIQAAAQTVTSSGYTGTYDGSAHGITVTQTGGTVTYSADGITYGADPLTYTGAGTYTVYFKVVKDNHSDYTGSETITINKASLTATYPGETIFFGETPILSVTVTGFVNSETELTAAGYVAPTVTNGNVDVGTYTLSPAGGSADNYEFTYVAGDLVIQAAAQTVTSSGYTGTYDGSAHGITVTQTGGTVTYSADGITYGADPLTYTGAGTYTVYFKVVKDNHSDYTGSETITINKASLTATYPGETIFFGETPILSVTVTGFVNSETELTAAGYVAPTVTNGNVDVGTYTLSPAGGSADNYEFTYVAGDLVIQAAAQTVTSSGYTGTYDGSAHGITVTQTGGTVTYSADGITYGADPLTYTGAGTYTVYFKVVKDNHSDYTGSETITINKASLTATYPGETIFFGETPILSVTVTGFVNSETELTAAGYVAPTVTNGNVDVGTYTLSPAGGSADNYEFTYVAGDLVIQAAAQTVTSSGYTGTYDGSAHGITVTQTGGTVTYSADGITYGADPLTYTGAGTYTVYFKVVKDNHSDYTGSETITINKASLTATYPGETIFFGETPILSVTVTGFVNSETELTAAGYVAPTVTNGNVDVGTYTLSPAGGSADNYEFTYVAGDLVIQAAAQTVTSSGYTGTYDGSAHGITVTQTGGTVTYSADGITYGADPLTYTGAGTYTVYFKVVKDNHSDYTGSETITINKASLTATYPGETIFFGETPILSVTVTGFVNSETELTAAGYVAPTVTNGNVDVGTYTLSPAGGSADNYEFTYVAGDLVIQAAAQTVTSSGYTGTYDGSAHGITVTQTGGTVTYSADGITYGADPLTYTGAGTYTVYFKVVKDNHSDYTGSETITINKKELAKPTDDLSTFTYTGSEQTYAPAGFDISTMTVSGAARTDAGSQTVAVSITDKTNYQWTDATQTDVTFDFTIGPKEITVTPDVLSKVYGGADPVFTYTLSETATVTGALSREAGEDVGTYAMTLGDLSAGGNYTLSLVPTNFAITKVPLTIKADDKAMTFGGAEPEYTVTYTGFVNGETQTALAGTLSVTSGYDSGVYAPTAVITASGLTSANYAITYETGVLTVSKIQVDAPTAVTGLAYSGIQQTGVVAATGYTLTGNTGIDAGDYTATATLVDGYIWSDDSTTEKIIVWSISQKEIIVIPDALSKVYGGSDPVFTYTLSETVAVTGALSREAGEDVGTYAMTLGDLSAGGNYTLSLVPMNFAISDPENVGEWGSTLGISLIVLLLLLRYVRYRMRGGS